MPEPTSIDRLSLRIEQWKNQLIDLSMRNRMLNYRAYKVSSVEIVDEVPGQVFHDLMDGTSFKFDPVPEEEQTEDRDEAEGAGESTSPLRNLTSGREMLYRPRDGSLEDRHTDDRLQTKHGAERLERGLIALARRAESSLEEQGINVLHLALGMLEWYESADSGTPRKAPLILVPVALERRSATAPFELVRGDEEPVLNPALAEKLRIEFNINLPELPEITDDLDVDDFFAQVRESVRSEDRWRLTSDIALAPLSFQKYLMYRDFQEHDEKLRKHRIVRILCREEPIEEDGGGEPPIVGGALPDDVANADLDETMGPWEAMQVLNADSSQQRAMLAVRQGHDLVIEGPPGTGKSQTITNMIADAIGSGKRVLFVSEKLAALEVVKDRLEDVGLGDFVLELHGRKVRKTEFVQELSRALDAEHVGFGAHQERDLGRLKVLTQDLRAYVSALHEPAGEMGISPFTGIARWSGNLEAPMLQVRYPDVLSTSERDLDAALRLLGDLAIVRARIGDLDEHPLRGVGLTRGGRIERAEIGERLQTARQRIGTLVEAVHDAAKRLGLREGQRFGDVSEAAAAARTMLETPGPDISLLPSDDWRGRPPDLDGLLSRLRHFQEARDDALKVFRPSIFRANIEDFVEIHGDAVDRGWVRWFMPSYWKSRGVLRSHLSPGVAEASPEMLQRKARQAVHARSHREWLIGRTERAEELFASHWSGQVSNADTLAGLAKWLLVWHDHFDAGRLSDEAAQLASDASFTEEDRNAAREMETALTRTQEAIRELSEVAILDPVRSGISHSDEARIGGVALRVDEMDESLDDLPDIARHNSLRSSLEQSVAAPFLRVAEREGVEAADIVSCFQRSLYDSWAQEVIEEREPLASFYGSTHQARIREFQDLDTRSMNVARERVCAEMSEARQRLVGDPTLRQKTQFLNAQARKRRNIAPVRRILHTAAEAVQIVKPCFMMSPLSVAQFLDPNVLRFDILIFDEASQIQPADAIGAFLRCDQIVVVGDSRQLPPTQFFSNQLDDDELEDVLDVGSGLQSILDEVAVSGVPRVRLKWHYRSQHESLIRFSNEEFYPDDPLVVFPHAEGDRDDLGLHFEYVEEGCYTGRGQNPAEAKRVAEEVAAHIRAQNGSAPTDRETLGVGTFGQRQANLVLDYLEIMRREEPSIEWFFNLEGEQSFFVKNLENIQGDDRDVIFLSVTYGPDRDGTISRNFGPINLEGGERRLNVLTTRAKKRLRVFSSMRGRDIDPRGVSPNVELVARYLKFAETGRYPTARRSTREPDSPFERQVIAALRGHGYDVVPQVGDSGYWIDLGILDPQAPGRYLCGIECDGATYHGAATVRDRDRLRQAVLESRGWTIHRVWSTDWFENPDREVNRLLGLIEETKGGEDPRRPVPMVPDPEPRKKSPEEPPAGPAVPLEQIPVSEYEVVDLGEVGTPEQFYTTPRDRLKDLIGIVISREGPIHADEVARRISGAFGLGRIGRRIRERILESLNNMQRTGQAQGDGTFFWPASWEDDDIVARKRSDEAPSDAELIAPVEAEAAIRTLLTHRAPLLFDDLVTESTRLLGVKRTGRRFRALIQAAYDRMTEKGILRPAARGIRLRKASKSEGDREELRLDLRPEVEEGWVRLDSSSVEAIRYDEKKSTLDVHFTSGIRYRYLNVEEEVFLELRRARKPGRFVYDRLASYQYNVAH